MDIPSEKFGKISYKKTWKWMKNFKRESESLQIAAQNNATRTNYVKVKIDNIQSNRKCRLYGDKEETTSHIIGECGKLAQKEYKMWHKWMRKVIDWELCKILKFDHTAKWYMHNPESFQENETHKILWDFEIQIDPLIPPRKP